MSSSEVNVHLGLGREASGVQVRTWAWVSGEAEWGHQRESRPRPQDGVRCRAGSGQQQGGGPVCSACRARPAAGLEPLRRELPGTHFLGDWRSRQ